jgi:hypothetical protein
MWGHTWLRRDPRPPIFGIALTHGALNPNHNGFFFFQIFGIRNLEIFLFQRLAKLVQFTVKIQIFQHLPHILCNKRQNLFEGK